MPVRDAISSYSRGELAPAKNTFVQPGTYKDNPDTAMTDGVPKAMLKAQREARSTLKNPDRVSRHLRKHHGISDTKDPVATHARQHTVGLLNQGHSLSASGELFHGSTDIGAGTSNFASEAPPMIGALELVRHVRTAEGAAFYHKSIGTPLVGDPAQLYARQKAADAAARQQLKATKAEKQVTSHSDLLQARRDARAKYPVGHPERLAAERAVRSSRKSTQYKDGRVNQAQLNPTKKAADARRDPGFQSPKGPREHLITGGAKTSATTVGIGGSFSDKAPTPVSTRQAQVNSLTPGERSQYFALRNAGAMHDRAMAQVQSRRQRGTVPPKVVAAATSRRKTKG